MMEITLCTTELDVALGCVLSCSLFSSQVNRSHSDSVDWIWKIVHDFQQKLQQDGFVAQNTFARRSNGWTSEKYTAMAPSL